MRQPCTVSVSASEFRVAVLHCLLLLEGQKIDTGSTTATCLFLTNPLAVTEVVPSLSGSLMAEFQCLC